MFGSKKMWFLGFFVCIIMFGSGDAGPIAWAICQTACNAGYVTCCAAGGSVAGTFTLGVGIPAAVAGCSVIQGVCMAACTPLLVAPTP